MPCSELRLMPLESMRQNYLNLISNTFKHFDASNTIIAMVIGAVINRAIALNKGFVALKQDNNFLPAIPLVRIQLDNCIRLFAYHCFKDKDAYVEWAISGKQLNRYKDYYTKEKLTDSYLLKKLDDKYLCAESLYKKTSSYVHFSDEIIKYTAKSYEGSREIEFRVGDFDEFSPQAKENILIGMQLANTILYKVSENIIDELLSFQTE